MAHEVCDGNKTHPRIIFDEDDTWAKWGEIRCPLCRIIKEHQDKTGVDEDYKTLMDYIKEHLA